MKEGGAALSAGDRLKWVGFGVLAPALLTVIAYRVHEFAGLGAVLALIGLAIILSQPFVGLLLFVAVLFVRPEETWPALNGLRLALGVSVLTLVGMLLKHGQRGISFVRSPVIGSLGGFAVWVVISTLPNGNTSEAAQDVFKLFLLAILIINLVRSPREYTRFSGAVLFFCGYLAAYSIYLCYTGQAIYDEGTVRSKATGIFGDPNDLSAAILGGIAIAACRVATSRIRERVFYLAYLGICIHAILLTNSRGGMLGTLVVLGAATLASVEKKGPAIAVALAAGALLIAFGPSRMRNFDSQEESANSRFWFWDNGVDLLYQSPLLGVGYGRFPEHNEGMTAHNTFVLCFGELGLPGYAFWMASLYFAFCRIPPSDRKEPLENSETDRRFTSDFLAARLALAGFLAAAFFLSRTYTPVLYVLISLPAACRISRSGSREDLPRTEAQRAVDLAWITAITIGSIALIKLIATTQK